MKIIITDDEAVMRFIYKNSLAKMATVVPCLDVETFHKEAPTADLIIADYQTFVPFEEVLKAGKPTILASGNPGVEHQFMLAKPFNREQLMQMIEKVLKVA